MPLMKTIEQLDFTNVKLILFDFDGVFTSNAVVVDENGKESVICNRYDGLGLKLLRDLAIPHMIVSTEKNQVVSRRAEKLGVDCVQGIDNKKYAVDKICSELKIDKKDTLFLGNDINDIPAFQSVGFPIAVADAWPSIFPYCLAVTNLDGGKGAVRELCEVIHEQREAC